MSETAVKEITPLEIVYDPEMENPAVEAEPAFEREPISDEVRERILNEELTRLDDERATLISRRRAKLEKMRHDPVLWGAVEASQERQAMGISSPAALSFSLERTSILREMSRSYTRHIVYMTKPSEEGGRGAASFTKRRAE